MWVGMHALGWGFSSENGRLDAYFETLMLIRSVLKTWVWVIPREHNNPRERVLSTETESTHNVCRSVSLANAYDAQHVHIVFVLS